MSNVSLREREMEEGISAGQSHIYGFAYESKQRSRSVTGVRKGFEGCQTLMSHPKLRVLPEILGGWELCEAELLKLVPFWYQPWRSLRLLVALLLYCIAFWPQEVSETISC